MRSERAEKTITITENDLERMAALYTAETGVLPPPEDMNAMIRDFARQEALVREARKLGLQEGDTVIDRRLAQKMEFIIADLQTGSQPRPSELETWYENNRDRFRTPARITFRHVFVSENSNLDPQTVLSSLSGSKPDAWKKMGDPFMLQRQYGSLPYRESVRIFGKAFSDTVFSLPKKETWQGPVSSALGQHLVYVEDRIPAALPAYTEIKQAVLSDWQDNQRRKQNADAIAELISRYEVVIESAER